MDFWMGYTALSIIGLCLCVFGLGVRCYHLRKKNRHLSQSLLELENENRRILWELDQKEVEVNAERSKAQLLSELEKKQRDLDERMRHVQKMEAIGRLAGGVAHEFNNFLTIILGNLKIAENKATGQLQRNIFHAKEAAEHSATLVQQLLDFSYQSKCEFKYFDINLLIDEILSRLRNAIDSRIQFVFQKGTNLPQIYADSTLLDMVMMNLCLNAGDAILERLNDNSENRCFQKQYVIVIKTGMAEVGENSSTFPIQGHKERYLTLSVFDNGCGIEPEVVSQVFDPFFTTKEVGKGTGLGLSSVYGIIQDHRGWIDLSSKPGLYTKFTIYLPLHSTL